MGTSSEPQVKHEIFFTGMRVRGVTRDENIEGDFLCVSTLTVDLATLTSVFARAADIGLRSSDGRGVSHIVVELFRKGGRILSGGDFLLRTVSIRYSMTCLEHTCWACCARRCQMSCAVSQALSFSLGSCASPRPVSRHDLRSFFWFATVLVSRSLL